MKPEIVHQEKSAATVPTSNEPAVDFNKPIRDPQNYAGVDNSMDGVLAVKH